MNPITAPRTRTTATMAMMMARLFPVGVEDQQQQTNQTEAVKRIISFNQIKILAYKNKRLK